jgi:hypothetical protein
MERLCNCLNFILSTYRSTVILLAYVYSKYCMNPSLTRQGALWIPSLKFLRSQSTSCEVKTAQVVIKTSFVVELACISYFLLYVTARAVTKANSVHIGHVTCTPSQLRGCIGIVDLLTSTVL